MTTNNEQAGFDLDKQLVALRDKVANDQGVSVADIDTLIALARRDAPATSMLKAEEMTALRRFKECADDGEGYDVPKEMMQRLAEIGVVQRRSGAYYQPTEFGMLVLNQGAPDSAAQPVQAGEAVDLHMQNAALRESLQAMLDGAWTPDVIAKARASLTPVSAQQGAAEKCEACNGDGYYEHKGSDTQCRVCGGSGATKAPAAQAVIAPTDEQIVQIYNRVQGRWSSFGGPLNAVLKFAREILAASPASAPEAMTSEQQPVAPRWTDKEIADACVKAGLGILECHGLLVTLKGSAPAVLDKDAKDAARYRWLRDMSQPGICAFYLSVGQAFKDVKFIPETVDAAIDAQIAVMSAHQAKRTEGA